MPDFESKKFNRRDLLMQSDIVSNMGKILAIRNEIHNDNLTDMITDLTGEKPRQEDTAIHLAENRLALPSFVDIHCHLRDPGYQYKEDIESGTRAAMWGGYSAVACMPNTNPVCDSPQMFRYIDEKAKKYGFCRVFPISAITAGMESKKLVDFDQMNDCGAIAFSDDGKPVTNASLLRNAMKKCAEKDYLIISHCEEMSLAEGGAVNEGRISKILGVKGIPNSSESVCVARDILLAEETGCRLHIAHVSTKESVRIIRDAKARGVRVTAETCPHYFSFTDEDVIYYGVNAKMNPPLRGRKDVDAVIEGLIDGTIDCISTDHAPHTKADKGRDIAKSAFGVIGLQTAFSAALTYLVIPGEIDIFRLSELMSRSPAKIIGVDKYGYGEIREGGRADINLVNLDIDEIFAENMIKSRSSNSPYIGLTLCGSVEKMYLNGRKVI